MEIFFFSLGRGETILFRFARFWLPSVFSRALFPTAKKVDYARATVLSKDVYVSKAINEEGSEPKAAELPVFRLHPEGEKEKDRAVFFPFFFLAVDAHP